jgi:hypothetical protein
VLSFFARDHASTEMVYANADLTKAEQAREIIAFADYWQKLSGEEPGLLVFDSKLTTYKVLSELTERGIRWLTLRERGRKPSRRCFGPLEPSRGMSVIVAGRLKCSRSTRRLPETNLPLVSALIVRRSRHRGPG